MDTKDLYVGRCHPQVSINHIKSHVKKEFNIELIECTVISKEDASVKAFKITVSSEKSEELLKGEKWPKDIRIRKFHASNNRIRKNAQ